MSLRPAVSITTTASLFSGGNRAAENATADICMAACPRYGRCSSPCCPLDPLWQRRSMLASERPCALMIELSRDGGEALLRGRVPDEVLDRVVAVSPAMIAQVGPVRRALRRAAKRGSKVATGIRLAASNREAAA